MALQYFKSESEQAVIKVADESVIIAFIDEEIRAYNRDVDDSLADVFEYIDFDMNAFETTTAEEYQKAVDSVLALLPF